MLNYKYHRPFLTGGIIYHDKGKHPLLSGNFPVCKSALTAAGRLRHHGGIPPHYSFSRSLVSNMHILWGGILHRCNFLIPLFRSFLTALTTRHLNFYRLDLIIRFVFATFARNTIYTHQHRSFADHNLSHCIRSGTRPFCSGNGSRFSHLGQILDIFPLFAHFIPEYKC